MFVVVGIVAVEKDGYGWCGWAEGGHGGKDVEKAGDDSGSKSSPPWKKK